MLTFINYPTRFDSRDMMAALKGSGIVCPNLKDYAWRLWDYWSVTSIPTCTSIAPCAVPLAARWFW
jgi:hypothetical protein